MWIPLTLLRAPLVFFCRTSCWSVQHVRQNPLASVCLWRMDDTYRIFLFSGFRLMSVFQKLTRKRRKQPIFYIGDEYLFSLKTPILYQNVEIIYEESPRFARIKSIFEILWSSLIFRVMRRTNGCGNVCSSNAVYRRTISDQFPLKVAYWADPYNLS